MVEIITYSLRNGQKNSRTYYQECATFTDEVLAEIKQCAGGQVKAYRAHIQREAIEAPRSFDEYAFELLLLGTLWRVYAANAQQLSNLPQQTLAVLGKWRNQHPALKPVIDPLRGWLGTVYLTSKNGEHRKSLQASLKNMDFLLRWMNATGELHEEVKRLQNWRDFLAQLPLQDQVAILETATSLGAWFEARSLDILGKYTPNVEQFLKEKHPSYRWREDVIMTGRQRMEYHLNMVGTEILNRAFRADFLQTEQKVVLLPPCMKAKPETECKATDTPLGQRCAACTPGCRVHQTTKLGEKHGFAVFIMPHELDVFSSGGIKPRSDKSAGIVGVSCPLTNVTGGWETKDLGVPAQGLLLDYCGCPWHWHEQGIPTDINFQQLLRIVGVKEPSLA